MSIQALRESGRSRRGDPIDRRLRAKLADLARRRADAQLRVPNAEHTKQFLAKTLIAVKTLMDVDITAAEHVLVRLGDIVRTAAIHASTNSVTLDEELELLVPVLDVERIVLRGRLAVTLDIEPCTRDVFVPVFVLQPLVASAVAHGQASQGGGLVQITARRTGARGESLRLSVEDDAAGAGGSATTVTIPWHDEHTGSRPPAWRSAARCAETELRALKAELNAHFIGNALATVSSLMQRDTAAAARVLDHLGDVLNVAAATTGTHEVTLREELDALAPFLEVERARFGDRLDMRWNVNEDALHGRVPHMILQPLVENAVKHGLAPRNGVGRIEVAARRARGRLELIVRDSGAGLDSIPGTAPHRPGGVGGVGLANARARLTRLYGSDASLELAPATGGGTVARVCIPWRGGDVETPR